MMTVIIADDQALLRKSLKQIISVDDDIDVIATADNGKTAIEECQRHQPNVILMDIEMPALNGIDALKEIKRISPETKVIILTTFENKDNIIEAFIANADGYITKDIGCHELIQTIKCVNYGLTVIHKSVKALMVNKFKRIAGGKKNYHRILTDEELTMIKLIVAGKSNKELSFELSYTEGTIKNKVSRMYEKLGIADRLQLAVFAVENGIE